jgi:hypothetical protein
VVDEGFILLVFVKKMLKKAPTSILTCQKVTRGIERCGEDSMEVYLTQQRYQTGHISFPYASVLSPSIIYHSMEGAKECNALVEADVLYYSIKSRLDNEGCKPY